MKIKTQVKAGPIFGGYDGISGSGFVRR